MTASDAGLLSPEIDGLLLRMRGLVLVRRRLADAISEPGTALGRRGDPLEL
jgi:hypothetical protein